MLSIFLNNEMENTWQTLNCSVFTHENSVIKFRDTSGTVGNTGVPRNFAKRQMLTLTDYRQFKKPYQNIWKFWSMIPIVGYIFGILLCVFYTVLIIPIWIMSFPGLDPLRRLIVRLFQIIFNVVRTVVCFLKCVCSDELSLKTELKTIWPNGIDDFINVIRLAILFTLSLRLSAFIFLLAEIIVHTLSGISLNTTEVSAYLILTVFMISFRTITSVHETYYKFLCTTVDIVFKMKNRPLFPEDLWHEDVHTGERFIKESLFEAIVEICEPVRGTVMVALRKIFLFGLLIGTIISILVHVHSNDMPDVISNVINLVIYVLLSQTIQIMTSKADSERKRQIRINNIKMEIIKYTLQNKNSDTNPSKPDEHTPLIVTNPDEHIPLTVTNPDEHIPLIIKNSPESTQMGYGSFTNTPRKLAQTVLK